MKKNLFYLSITTFSYYIVVGVALSIFSIILKENNVGDFLIGLSDSIRRLSGICFMFFVPYLVNRLGLYKMSLIAILLYTITLLLMPFFVNYYLWIFYIVLFGCGMMSFMTFIDSVLNVMVQDKNRSQMNAILNIIVLCGIALAPIVLKFTGSKSYFIFILCGILNIINLISYSKLKTEYKDINFIKQLNLVKFIKELPYVFLSKIFLEFTGTTLFIFTIIYANSRGYSYENAGLLLSLYCLSGLLFSYPTGYLFDKTKDKEKLLIKGTLITVGLIFFIPTCIFTPYLMFTLYFLLGISTGFIHLGCLVIINENYKKDELISANATLEVVGSTSIIFAGIISGFFMQYFNSMTASISILGLIYATVVFMNKKLSI